MTAEDHVLLDIDDTDLMVASPEEDVRGKPVIDKEGNEVGEVDGLLIDEEECHVRFLQVGSGGILGLGKKTRLIPANAVVDVGDAVHVDTTVSTIAGSPSYDPDLQEARASTTTTPTTVSRRTAPRVTSIPPGAGDRVDLEVVRMECPVSECVS